jgi:hypothetical protein
MTTPTDLPTLAARHIKDIPLMSAQTAESTSRDAIIARIQKLRAMTIAAGASETEAAFAAKRIAELIAEHSIGETEFTLTRDRLSCTRDRFAVMASAPEEWRAVMHPIKQLFSVKAWGERELSDILGIGRPIELKVYHFFGFPADVAAAVSLAEICQLAVLGAVLPATKALGAPTRGNAKRLWTASFRTGMAQRLAERITALIPPPVMSQGTALIVVKDQLVTEEFAKLGLRLVPRSFGTVADPHALAAGRAAAERVDLGGAKVGRDDRKPVVMLAVR